jgi:hypothetical protein
MQKLIEHTVNKMFTINLTQNKTGQTTQRARKSTLGVIFFSTQGKKTCQLCDGREWKSLLYMSVEVFL